MPSNKSDWEFLKKNNRILVSLVNENGKGRHIHCFEWHETETDYVLSAKKKNGKVVTEALPKNEWKLGKKVKHPKLAARKKHEAEMAVVHAAAPMEYHVPEDAPGYPVQKPAISHQETLKSGTIVTRHPGDLTKELPGEYNAWAHRNDPPDEEAMFKLKVATESEFARQEGMRQYQIWKAKREGKGFREHQTGGGIGVGVAPPKR